MKSKKIRTRVRKVVIPVAGFGTRFLPATKAMPKEMLPILDKPVIQYVVEEAVASGIEEVILVTSHTKRSVEDHFDFNSELETWLSKTGKLGVLKDVQRIGSLAKFVYIRQKGPYGNATPILNAEHLIEDEPFAVMFGDELFDSRVPRLKQLIQTFQEVGHPVLASVKVDEEGTKRYGILEPKGQTKSGTFELKGMVEKPGPKKAPSRMASIGSYVLTPDIFKEIRALKPKRGEEYVLLNAVLGLMKHRPIFAKEIEGVYHDTGSRIGWLGANIAMALKRPEMQKEVKAMLKSHR